MYLAMGPWAARLEVTAAQLDKRLPKAPKGLSGAAWWEERIAACEELLRELGDRLGALDVENQLGSLELSLQKAWDQEKKAREEYQNKSRVFRYLGALGGLFLIVLVL